MMKRITMDFSAYESERKDIYNQGYLNGLKRAAEYLESGKTWEEFTNIQVCGPTRLTDLWERIEKAARACETRD